MATPSRKTKRICAGIACLIAAAVGSGCAARAEYVYDEPVVYRRGPVYAPPPVVVYREGHPHYYAPPRREVRVYRAPVHVHRAPPSYHEHRHERRRDDRDDRHHHH